MGSGVPEVADNNFSVSIPETLGHYRILGLLGRGGMGEVYAAEDTRLHRKIAVKVLPERLAGDPKALARFEREAKAVAALSHLNILAIHDVGSEGGVRFAVTELLRAEPRFKEMVRKVGLPTS